MYLYSIWFIDVYCALSNWDAPTNILSPSLINRIDACRYRISPYIKYHFIVRSLGPQGLHRSISQKDGHEGMSKTLRHEHMFVAELFVGLCRLHFLQVFWGHTSTTTALYCGYLLFSLVSYSILQVQYCFNKTG